MKKIPSLFKRNYDGDRGVYNEVVEGSEWVVNGEGVATIKWDGTAVMFNNGQMYKRYDCKKGKQPPEKWIPCEPERNEHTGHWPGWVRVDKDNPEDKWFIEGRENGGWNSYENHTYELCGPKVNGNPEKFKKHTLIPHGYDRLPDCPRDFDSLRSFFLEKKIEGIVWWHPDGRMVKIKKRDFGLTWP